MDVHQPSLIYTVQAASSLLGEQDLDHLQTYEDEGLSVPSASTQHELRALVAAESYSIN